MSRTRHTKRSRQSLRSVGSIAALVAAACSILLAALLFLNRQYIVDQVTVWQYQPDSAIAAFADRSGMNGRGTFTFYASRPELMDAGEFNDKCRRVEETTAILGCYTGQRTYIYNVTNEQLDGIRDVTAAHEMLHAAYERLSSGDRDQVNALLEAEFATLKHDPAFAERMAVYDRIEPGERDNELHSIIGTEVAVVSPELEAHYKAYFADRSKVIALHASYAAVFAQLQDRAKDLSDQLTALGDTIKADSEAYNADITQLNADIQQFNAQADSGGFSSDAQFQAERSALVARTVQLDTRRAAINDAIARYNLLRDELMTVASESEALNQSIDSTLAPAPSI